MTKRIIDKEGLWGFGKLRYGGNLRPGNLFYGAGCMNHTYRALLGVGVVTLPINIHPLVLHYQLVLRQIGIYASPYLINH